MIVCPVCENQQPSGDSCDVCGKQLTAVKGGTAQVAPLPELEGTFHTGPQNVVAQPIEGLEVTQLGSPTAVATERVDGLETTQVANPKAPVAVQPVPELERGREVDDGVRTAAPTGAVSCRYCGNVQAEGLLCARCGMRLPRAKIQAAAEPGVRRGEPVWTRCLKCGAPAKAGGPCGDCGNEVAFPEDR